MNVKSLMYLAGVLWLWSSFAAAQIISIQNATIVACKDIRIKYSAVAPTDSVKGHWVTIAEQSLPDNANSYRFKFLPPNTSHGIVNLSTRGLNPFSSYEIRLYYNWDTSRSYQVVARQTFNVQASNNCLQPLLGSVDSEVLSGEPVNFSFFDLKQSSSNWVVLARPNQTAPNFVKSIILPAVTQGEFAIPTAGLAPGQYELRLFEDWSGTKEYVIYDRALVTIK